MWSSIVAGGAAGAAGTTALNAVTYLDMAVRGRGPSSTPEQTVEKVTELARLRVPGDDESHGHRVSALGALTGLLTGVVAGAAYGALTDAAGRPAWPVGALLVGLGAMAGANGPMAVLGISDPRQWSTTDWLSDVVPHLAYGAVTAATFDLLDT